MDTKLYARKVGGAAERSHRSPLGASSFSQQVLGMWAETAYSCEGEGRGVVLEKKIEVQAFQTWSEYQLKQRPLFANLPLAPPSSMAQ